jgi:fatty acid desaturase
MAKQQKTATVENKEIVTHVRLLKYPAKKAFSVFVTGVLTVFFAAWIWAGLRKGNIPWYAMAVPMVFVGLLTTLLQPEEEWEYTPWQEAPQKYEKNIYD